MRTPSTSVGRDGLVGLIKKRELQDRQIHLNLNYGTNKPLLVNETMGQKQRLRWAGPWSRSRRSIPRPVSEFNGISLRRCASRGAVTQVHGECIGRTVNRGPPRCSAILDFCFICFHQSGCSPFSSPIISWPAFFLLRFICYRLSGLNESPRSTCRRSSRRCTAFLVATRRQSL